MARPAVLLQRLDAVRSEIRGRQDALDAIFGPRPTQRIWECLKIWNASFQSVEDRWLAVLNGESPFNQDLRISEPVALEDLAAKYDTVRRVRFNRGLQC